MLSPKEKRFIKYWEEQRTGGRVSYFALYIPVITIITAIITSFLFSMISMIGVSYFVTMGVLSLVFGVAVSIYTWLHNERRFKGIIKREIRQGEQKDQAGANHGYQ